MGSAYSSYSSVNNKNAIDFVYGQYIDYFQDVGASVDNSYGLFISEFFNKGTVDNFAIYSESDADSYFEGNIGFGERAPKRQIHVSEAMRLEPQATAPANGALGDLYVGTNGNLYFNDGTGWKVVQVL